MTRDHPDSTITLGLWSILVYEVVMPLGPYNTFNQIIDPVSGNRLYRKVQTGVRNSKVERSKPSPYRLLREFSEGGSSDQPPKDAPNTWVAYQGQTWTGKAGSLRDQAINKCYEKFVSQVRDSASMGTTLAERKEAVSMIANRAGQIVSQIRRIRRGDLSSLRRRKTTQKKKVPTVKGATKDLSSLWLEYHFGWEPLVKDIYEAVDILQSPFPYAKPVLQTASLDYIGSWVTEDAWHTDRTSWNVYQRVLVRMQGRYSAQNPMLMTANQLGLTNPVAIAWELVPFSFVVDWFSSVGQVLSASTDFLGVQREDEFTTCVYESVADERHRYINDYEWMGVANFRYGSNVTERTMGILGPRLALKPFKGFSLTRGATAIALLVGFLK